jgi:hypothetical protein
MPEWVQVMCFFVGMDALFASFQVYLGWRETDKAKKWINYVGAMILMLGALAVIVANVWRHVIA